MTLADHTPLRETPDIDARSSYPIPAAPVPRLLRYRPVSFSLRQPGSWDPRRLREELMRGRTDGRLLTRLHGAAALIFALAIFALDILSPLQGAVAVLYTIVVLIASRAHDRSLMLLAAMVSAALAMAGYGVSHWGSPLGSPAMRLGVSLVAIAITTFLCVRIQGAAEERRRSEERYRTIFNAAGLPIWESDWSEAFAALRLGAPLDIEAIDRIAQSSTVRDANDAAARLFGLPDRAALIGRDIVAHHTPAARETFGHIIVALARGDAAIEEETQFLSASGDVVDVVIRVTLPPGTEDWKRVLGARRDRAEPGAGAADASAGRTDPCVARHDAR